MNYDVVIATRNRPEALKLSIPLILSQGRKPHKLIIVDASDNHEKVKSEVQDIEQDYKCDIQILFSGKACSAHQRNLGLAKVNSPVVMFPDDDSLWWPGVAKAIMRIYELDTKEDIGGVCAAATLDLPPNIKGVKPVSYKMDASNRFRQSIEHFRRKIESKLFPDPILQHGRSKWDVKLTPEWLPETKSVLVEYMSGHRMSFRTQDIKNCGFSEELGRFVGWAAKEDVDASFSVLRKKLLVGTHNAKVCHYQFPGKRLDGYAFGFIQLFNTAYVIFRNVPAGDPIRDCLTRFCRYKTFLYSLRAFSGFGKNRVRGALTALKCMKELSRASEEELRDCYLRLAEKYLGKR